MNYNNLSFCKFFRETLLGLALKLGLGLGLGLAKHPSHQGVA